MRACPHCGGSLEPSLAALVDLIDRSTHYGRMLALLAPRLGEWVSRDEILNAFYGPTAEGPEDETGIVKVTAFELRKRIAGYGLTIEGRSHRGGSAYRLLKVNVENETWQPARLMP